MQINIARIHADSKKKETARYILEALPEWFGIPEAKEEYIRNSAGKDFFCAYVDDEPAGFLYLTQTGKDTAELAVMGVLKAYHRNGIGRRLFENAKEAALEIGYSFLQVKTVQMENMRIMIKQICSMFPLDSRSLKCFRHYGAKKIPVRSM